MNVETKARIALKLQSAIYRESLALVEMGIADAADVDRIVTNSIGRRWSVGGPFEIWEQILFVFRNYGYLSVIMLGSRFLIMRILL